MTLPDGITTCTVTVGSLEDFAGEIQTISVTWQPVLDGKPAAGNVRSIVWAATGQPLASFPERLTPEAGEVSFDAPHVDQPGFIDGTGSAVTGWWYRVKVTARDENRKTYLKTKDIQVVQGQDTVDFDLIPDGTAVIPATTPTATVTSVNGETGAVTVPSTGDVAAVSDALAAEVTRATTAEGTKVNSSTYTAGLATKQATATRDHDVATDVGTPASETAVAVAAKIAALIAAGNFATAAALTAGLATKASTAQLASALAVVPTFEELGHGAQLPASISATTTVILETALLPCLCPQVSLAFSGAVAASDTVYWKVELLRLRTGAVSVIATKTSKTVASGGEGITALIDWNFDTLTFLHRLLHKGDSLALRFTPVGSPAALTGGVASYRTIPDDGGVDPVVTLVSDTFTRADSTAGLGVADTGQTYTNYGSWGISSNQAYVPATTGADAAMVDTGQSDITIQVKLAAIAVGGSLGLRIRQIGDNTSGTAIQMNLGTLFYFTAPGANATIGTFSQAFVAGDSVRFVAVGSLIKVYRDAGTTGSWVLVLTVTETRNQLATVHGIRSSANAGNASRFDNLLIQSA